MKGNERQLSAIQWKCRGIPAGPFTRLAMIDAATFRPTVAGTTVRIIHLINKIFPVCHHLLHILLDRPDMRRPMVENMTIFMEDEMIVEETLVLVAVGENTMREGEATAEEVPIHHHLMIGGTSMTGTKDETRDHDPFRKENVGIHARMRNTGDALIPRRKWIDIVIVATAKGVAVGTGGKERVDGVDLLVAAERRNHRHVGEVDDPGTTVTMNDTMPIGRCHLYDEVALTIIWNQMNIKRKKLRLWKENVQWKTKYLQ